VKSIREVQFRAIRLEGVRRRNGLPDKPA